MKTVVLIFSIILSLLGILVGQFAYPFMASLFDSNPFWVSLYIGVPLSLIICTIVLIISKQKFIRISIILPCILSCAITSFVLHVFSYPLYCTYQNGYIHAHGIRNKFGIKIINSWSIRNGIFSAPKFFLGKTQNGNTVIISAEGKEHYIEEDDDNYARYYCIAKLRLEYYDEKGNLLESRMHEKRVRWSQEFNEEEWLNDCINYYEDAYIYADLPNKGKPMIFNLCSKEKFEKFI